MSEDRSSEMDEAAAVDPVAALGPRIREQRKGRGLTLSDVAGRTGLSVGHLSQVERGLSTPTIRQLQQISDVVEVEIGWFFRAAEAEQQCHESDVVVRAGHRPPMPLAGPGILDEGLVPIGEGTLRLLLRTLQPGAAVAGPEPRPAHGEEAGFILDGEMELVVEAARYHLRPGDSFAVSSARPHRYSSIGAVPLRIVWASAPTSGRPGRDAAPGDLGPIDEVGSDTGRHRPQNR